MTRRPREEGSVSAPGELERLLEAEARLEQRLTAARRRAERRVADAQLAASAAEREVEAGLEPELATLREEAARELAAQLAESRLRTQERVAALERLEPAALGRFVDRLLERVAGSRA